MAFVYVIPENSSYNERVGPETLHVLKKDLDKLPDDSEVLLMCDFNAQTSVMEEVNTVEVDHRHIPELEGIIDDEDIGPRKSQDDTLTDPGSLLIHISM